MKIGSKSGDVVETPREVVLPPPTVAVVEPKEAEFTAGAVSAPVEEMVTIIERDAVAGEFVKHVVPKSQADVITARQMSDASERADANAYRTDMYDQDFHYYFANKSRDHIGTVEPYQLGYLPHRHNGSLPHGHSAEKVPGWGDKPVITVGDSVLMAIPRAEYEERQRRKEEAVRREKMHRSDRLAERGNDLLASHGLGGDRDRVIQAQYDEGRSHEELTMNSQAMDSAQARALSLQQAQEFAGMQSGSSFGGFRGTPEYNKAVPESPRLRT